MTGQENLSNVYDTRREATNKDRERERTGSFSILTANLFDKT